MLPAFDAPDDELLHQFLLGGIARDFFREMARHDHDAVDVADHDVARIHRHAAARDRHVHVHRVMLREIERRARARAEERQADVADRAAVAHAAVRHHARDAAHFQAHREDRSGRCNRAVAATVLHEHAAGRRAFHRLALRMIGVLEHADVIEVFARRDIAQRERRADEVRRTRRRLDERRDALQEHVAQAALEELRRERRGADVAKLFERGVADGEFGGCHGVRFRGEFSESRARRRCVDAAAGSSRKSKSQPLFACVTCS